MANRSTALPLNGGFDPHLLIRSRCKGVRGRLAGIRHFAPTCEKADISSVTVRQKPWPSHTRVGESPPRRRLDLLRRLRARPLVPVVDDEKSARSPESERGKGASARLRATEGEAGEGYCGCPAWLA